MLKTLREFRGDFDSVTLAPDGTISVSFAKPEAERPRTPKAPKERLTAIEALSRRTPDFDFEVPS